MDFKKFIIENHPDPDSVFGIDKYDFEQIVILAENFAKKEVEAINYTHCCEELKCDHEPRNPNKKYTSCKKCGMHLQMKP